MDKHILNFNEAQSLFTTDNKIKSYEKEIINSVISYMKELYNFDAKIIVKKKPYANDLFGHLVLNDNAILKNKFHIYVHIGYHPLFIRNLIHEITHCKQVVLKELLPSDDYQSFIWKGVENITVKDYKKLIKSRNITEYKKLPWEKEAYYNQEHLYDKYLESKQFKDLRGKNITLDFVLDNL